MEARTRQLGNPLMPSHLHGDIDFGEVEKRENVEMEGVIHRGQ